MLTERFKRMAGLPYDMDKLLIELAMDPSDSFDGMDPSDTPITDDKDTDPTDRDMSAGMDDGMGQLDATADQGEGGDIRVTALDGDDDDISDDADAAADMQDTDKMSFADMMAGAGDEDGEGAEPEDVKLKQLDLLQQLISALGLDDMMGGLKDGQDAAADDSDLEDGAFGGEGDDMDGFGDAPDEVDMESDEDQMDADVDVDLDMDGGADAFGGDAVDMEEPTVPEEEEQSFDDKLNNDKDHPLANLAPDHAKDDISHLIKQMNSDSSAEWTKYKGDLTDFITKSVTDAFNGDISELNASIELFNNLGIRGPVYQELRQMQQTLNQGPVADDTDDTIDFDAVGTSSPQEVDLTGMEVRESKECNACIDVAQGIYTKPAPVKEDKVPNMKVPSDVRSALKSAISDFKKKAVECAALDQSRDALFNEQVATVLETIETHLGSDRCDLVRASTFVNSLKGDLIRLIPESVYKYISQGGYERNNSIRAYFDAIKTKK